MPEQCVNCGSNDFSLMDGYFFCNMCGTQSSNLRETEDEFTELTKTQQSGKGVQRIKIRRPADETKEKMVRKSAAATQEPKEEVLEFRDRAIKTADYPPHLQTIGTRLCTFTKLVSKISHILVDEFEVPFSCVKYSQKIMQIYFKKFGVAFHDKELGVEGDDLFTPYVKRTHAEMTKLKDDNAQKLKKSKEDKREQRRSQLSLWEQLATQEQEEEEDDSELEDDGVKLSAAALGAYEKVETKLSAETAKAASVVYLEIDMILAVVHISALLSGCRWIQLSDLFRWYREGRFSVTKTQLNALAFSRVWRKGREMDPLTRRNWMLYEAIQPSSENLRTLAFLTQFTEIPKTILGLDFSTVLSRMVYALNLPRVFLHHLNMLCSLLPPVNVDCGASYFSSIIPLADSVKDTIISKKHFGPRSYFQGVFKEKINCSRDLRWQMLSSETKAAGMLLFAMKLFFGLDDKRESKLTPVLNEYNDDLEAFNFVEWIQQLRLRMHVWQGKSIDTVTSKGFSADQSATDDGVPIRRNLLGSSWYRQRQRNDEIFKMCVPNYLQDRHQEFLFERLCVDKEVKRSNDSKEALFTPLMFHAKMNEDFVAHISTCNDGGKELANVDLKNLEVFFKSFVNSHMDFKCTEKLDKAYDDNSRSTLPDLPASNSTSPNVFHRCFPCSDAYLKISEHNIPCLASVTRRSVHVQVKCATEAEAVISRTSVVNLFNSSKRFFSSNFATLLRHFAITVCETEDLIYLAFLMCESMFFDRSSHQALEDDIRARSPIFLEHKNTGMRLHESVLDGSSAHKFKYKLFGIRKNVHAEATADSAVAEVPATRTQAEGGSGEAVEVDQNAAMRAGEETITEVPLAVDDEESDGSAGLESDSSLDEVIDEDSTQLITVVVPQPLALALVGF